MRRFASAAAALFIALSASPALADAKIGSATNIEKQVSSEQISHFAVGDPIHANETISTAAASRGVFAFEDRTTLQVGPSSKVKLTNFVYSGGGSGKNAAFNAAKGVFRFVSAPGAHRGYEVKTPTAVIAVRGTVFFVRVRPGATDAGIEQGSIEVCPTNGGACQTLETPCTFVTVTSAGASQPRSVGESDWSFDGLCSPTRRADDPSSPPPSLPGFGGPSFGVTLGSMIGDTHFADPQPLNGGSFLGGLKLGYDFMLADKFLVGFETDAQYHSEIGGAAGLAASRAGYIGTARARLGYALLDRAIVYGTGGLAYGDILAPQSFAGAGLLVPGYSTGYSKHNPVLPGYAVGGGVQYALGGGVSLRAEYLYLHLAHDNPVYATAWGDRGICNISAAHGVRLGLDFSLSPDTLRTLQGWGR